MARTQLQQNLPQSMGHREEKPWKRQQERERQAFKTQILVI